MNRSFKCVFATALLAAFGIVNAQEGAAPVEEAIPAEEAVPAELAAPAETVIQEKIAPVLAAKPVLKPKKKRKAADASKSDFALVDFPANFEIQGKKNMAIDSEPNSHNLDEWWGRANLMVVTESENFSGRVHLRMYPGEFANKVHSEDPDMEKLRPQNRDLIQIYEAWAWYRGEYLNLKVGRIDNTTRFGSMNFGGYLDAKRDKYWDARNNQEAANNYNSVPTQVNKVTPKNSERRVSGFMSSYDPENALQFGLNFENLSFGNLFLDIALISTDNKLDKGDLRTHFRFNDIAGIEDLNLGIGYRSNLFNEINRKYGSKYGDVVHTLDFGVRVPVLSDVGFLKNLNLFLEAALIGLDDQNGTEFTCDDEWSEEFYLVNRECRTDRGKTNSPEWPILGGIDISLYRGLDKIVIEAEYDKNRRKNAEVKEHVKDILGSIFIQKALNDRFTVSLGLQSEGIKKDFSLAGRLQGRIN